MKNKTIAAFGLLAIVGFISCIPQLSWNMKIAYFIAGIFEIIAACILINNLKGPGKAGAILLLLSILSGLVAYSLQAVDLLSNIEDTLLDLERLSYDPFSGSDDFDGIDKNTIIYGGSFSLLSFSYLIKFILIIACSICWLTYEPFKRMQSAVIFLLCINSFYLIWNIALIFTSFEVPWPLTYSVDLFFWILGFLVVLCYLNMAADTNEELKDKLKVKSLLVFALGLIYTYLLLVDTGYKSILYTLIGSIIFLVGTGNLRDLTNDKRGTGGFIAYGILMIVTCLFQLIPVFGKYIAFCIHLAGFIVLGVGLFKFNKSPIFYKGRPTGMNTLGTISLLLIGGLITALLPGMGEKISGFIFCILFVPMILYSFYNMIKAALPINKISVAENVSPAPVPPPLKTEVPDYTKYMPSYKKEEEYKPIITLSTKHENPLESKIPEPITVVPERKASNQSLAIIGIVLGLFLIAGGIFAYQYWYKPHSIDKNAPRYYTFNNTNLRSSKLSGTNANLLSILPYGSELIVYEMNADWSYVKYNNTKGYISTTYLIAKDDFFLLHSIFGNDESRECISTAKCRLALLDYYKQKYLYGEPHADMADVHAQYETNWQVFTKAKDVKPNTILYPRIFNRHSKFTDFAVIIENTISKERRLLIFTFDDETEVPTLIHEEEAPFMGNIKEIWLSPNYFSRNNIRVQYGF